ncbi:3-deoxy-manno-octulosonate-8-phosphatase KdsC [Permianibacter aggregans]|uniref:3-deoxy-D-manno-octulosonate 8-phosphate phosphatase KdsC n=1 Tax=Permianibacter aggregans TaxID=1510150 RepID=A0A4R6UK85_9GAMM|nr:3-deoxy-manno-octulosonate-8-phosphatase KdsC [Permianibacter aggregans]TDQ46546.1 3-deoxy-D-manno-octulosonate 8-phosphate phosphatase (KDO 8-P phosphatase) [Permianibacter aggregans]
MDQQLLQRARAIRLLICDVDGVLTDGSVILGNNGEELKAFNIKDGFGIKALQKFGVEVALITGRQSKLVETRARELGISQVFQGNTDKRGAFNQLLQQLNLTPMQVAHIGDDLPDLPLFMRVGLAVAPSDGHPWMRERAHFVTVAEGGRGCVRELADLILHAQGHVDALLAQYDAEPGRA